MLHLGVVAEEISPTVMIRLKEKLSSINSLGQVENQLYLLINTYAQSLADWHEKLSDLGVEIIDERNIEEAIEAIAFRQMMS